MKRLIEEYNPIKTFIPDLPQLRPLIAYQNLNIDGQLLLSKIINSYDYVTESENIVPMEMLPINNNSGQSYGYIVYRKEGVNFSSNAILKIKGYVGDTILVMVNGRLISPVPKNKTDIEGFGFWKLEDSTLNLGTENVTNGTLDLVVENFGRNSQGQVLFKGLNNDVYIDGEKIVNWKILPLEFKKSWSNSLTNWHNVVKTVATPALYKFSLNIDGEPDDSYIDMREWTKGLIIVNGFVLSRHFFFGPQQTAYLPAPLLKSGNNIIIVFEHYNARDVLKFSDKPIYDVKS